MTRNHAMGYNRDMWYPPLHKNEKQEEMIYIEDVGRGDVKKVKNENARFVFNLPWIGLLCIEVCLYSSYSPLVHLCQVDGQVPFSSASLVLLIEIFKICISVALFIPEVLRVGLHLPPLSFCLPLCVPAVLYTFNNNLAVIMQQEMDPTTYQILGNMKIATTAVLYRIIMKRELSRIKWLSLVLLTLAGVLDCLSGSSRNQDLAVYNIYLTLKGVFMMLTYCSVSGLSGVFTEFIFKKNLECSIHLQNIILYIMGIVLNISIWLYQKQSLPISQEITQITDDSLDNGLLKGFSYYTWLIVITQALNGLIMSVIMKYGSNITKLFIVTCSMLMTTVLSVFIFHIQLSFLFICALILVVLSLYLYHSNN